jgi:hypothetical protein
VPEVTVEGADKLALLGAAVRKLGSDRTVLKHLTARIRGFAPPAKAELAASALTTLPRAGGLGAWVAMSRVTVSVRRGTQSAGVTITQARTSKGGKKSDLTRIDAGRTRHPLWGNRKHWYGQDVTSGYWSDVIAGPVVDEFTTQTVAAIDDAIAEVLSAW